MKDDQYHTWLEDVLIEYMFQLSHYVEDQNVMFIRILKSRIHHKSPDTQS